jgi:hypothetical protein
MLPYTLVCILRHHASSSLPTSQLSRVHTGSRRASNLFDFFSYLPSTMDHLYDVLHLSHIQLYALALLVGGYACARTFIAAIKAYTPPVQLLPVVKGILQPPGLPYLGSLQFLLDPYGFVSRTRARSPLKWIGFDFCQVCEKDSHIVTNAHGRV